MSYRAWFGGLICDDIFFNWYHPIVIPLLSVAFILILLALLFLKAHRKFLYVLLVILLVCLIICNNHLMQPWQYTHALLLGALVFNHRFMLTLVLGGMYFWSGLNKFNPWFYEEVFCWFFSPISDELPLTLSYIVPLLEMFSGILLLFSASQRSAALFCIIKHIFIASLLSPLFLNWNTIVIPWNIALAFILFLIYFPKNIATSPVKTPIITYTTLLFVWIGPAFWYISWWPTPLSFHLYSGHHQEVYLMLENNTTYDLNLISQTVYGLPLNLNENTAQSMHSKITLILPQSKVILVDKPAFSATKNVNIYE
jgi:hypothetical protein